MKSKQAGAALVSQMDTKKFSTPKQIERKTLMNEEQKQRPTGTLHAEKNEMKNNKLPLTFHITNAETINKKYTVSKCLMSFQYRSTELRFNQCGNHGR